MTVTLSVCRASGRALVSDGKGAGREVFDRYLIELVIMHRMGAVPPGVTFNLIRSHLFRSLPAYGFRAAAHPNAVLMITYDWQPRNKTPTCRARM